MKYDLKWLKILHSQLQERYRNGPTTELMFSLDYVSKQISAILEHDTPKRCCSCGSILINPMLDACPACSA